MDAKSFLKQKYYLLKAKRITTVEVYVIRENIRLKIKNDTEDYTKGVNGGKMDANVTVHQKRNQDSNNTGFGKVENNKHPSAEREQHTVTNKLKEDFQLMWNKVRLLQMSEREKLRKLKKR